MKTVDVVNVNLSWIEDDPGPPAPHLLRGAIGNLFRENPLFHQHDDAGVIYRYPHVQYRWDRRGAGLLGIGEGAQAIVRVDWPGLELRIGERKLHVREAVCEFKRHPIALTDQLTRYRFVTPWLPLNQELYQRYRGLTPEAQVIERDRLAVAGLLLALRGFGVEIQGRLFAAFEMRSSLTCDYKGIPLLGFHGRLITNLNVPNGFALGRSVSHGYGWIEREDGFIGRGVGHERQGPDGPATQSNGGTMSNPAHGHARP